MGSVGGWVRVLDVRGNFRMGSFLGKSKWVKGKISHFQPLIAFKNVDGRKISGYTVVIQEKLRRFLLLSHFSKQHSLEILDKQHP